jgi:hypothetical protein
VFRRGPSSPSWCKGSPSSRSVRSEARGEGINGPEPAASASRKSSSRAACPQVDTDANRRNRSRIRSRWADPHSSPPGQPRRPRSR